MSLEQEIFSRRTLKPETLEPFGFVREGRVWRYQELFLDGDFRAEVSVADNGQVLGRVFDVADDEEYLPVHVDSYTGAFVGSVREGYTAVLQRIADSCFEAEYFLYDQTNRITKLILERYGEKPDFPFSTAPTYGVFRVQKNRKWYGLVMNIRLCQLTGEKVEKAEDSPVIEVLNLKVDEKKQAGLLKIPGIWPSYHMNHKSWISILLDGTVPDGQIMELMETSRSFALRAGKKERTGPVSWIVPANPKYYDVDAAFAEKDEILWKQGRGVRVGDTAYLYVAAPVSAVRYRCLVTETEIPYSFHSDEVSMTHVMKIRLEKTYPPEAYPMARLREMGMKTFQGVHPAPQAFLEEAEKEE